LERLHCWNQNSMGEYYEKSLRTLQLTLKN
jgi:hypothetical protein